MHDQATSLRLMASKSDGARSVRQEPSSSRLPFDGGAQKTPHTLAITSGKGGVGKTSVATNLAIMLAMLGRRIVVLDADAGLANVDVMLGLAPKYHIGHLLNGLKSLSEIMIEGPHGIRIVPASSGVQKLSELTWAQCDHLLGSIGRLPDETDYVLVDTAAGISDNVVHFLRAAGEIVVVCEPEPTAIVDAYAVIKVMHGVEPGKPLSVLINSVESDEEAMRVYDQLDRVASRFIRRRVDLMGFIYRDPSVPMAVCNQTAVVSSYPNAPASRCFKTLARHILSKESRPQLPSGAYLKLYN